MARLLVIDDHPLNLALAAAVLESDGHEVIQAADAEHACTLLETLVPDMILTDIGLPGMDGLALTRRVKADPHLGHVPVIALTAFAMKGDEDRALEAGCDGYISKPIDMHALIAVVSRTLRHHDAPRRR